MGLAQAFVSGVAGAVALNVLHETARQFIPGAPRVEVIGMRAIARPMEAAGGEPPARDQLYYLALAGDIVSNGIYYGMVGIGKPGRVWTRGSLLGLAGGVGAAFLPQVLGLGKRPGERFPATHLMTVEWYMIGGLVAAAVYERLGDGG